MVLFINVAIVSRMSTLKESNIAFIKSVFFHSMPPLLLLSILAWIITINVKHFNKINKGKVANEYNSYSTVSTLLIVIQLGVLFKYLADELMVGKEAGTIKGKLDGDLVYVIVCHWPSRRGGSYLREGAAKFCKNYIRQIQEDNPSARIIIMGDLNDDPVSPSVKNVIMAKGNKDQVKKMGFYNPWMSFYKKGFGTLAYRDSWNLFDQILISQSLLEKNEESYYFYKNSIFNKSYLISKGGRFKGYPFRTYSFGTYIGGYSDHLPVCIYLIKKI